VRILVREDVKRQRLEAVGIGLLEKVENAPFKA
jgi:hypothetical protein